MPTLTLLQALVLIMAMIGNFLLIEVAMDYHWSAGLTTLGISLLCWCIAINAVFGGA